MNYIIKFCGIAVLAIGCVVGTFGSLKVGRGASFGINFGAGIGNGNGGWGPYYLDPAHGTSAHGYAGHASAFGVIAANWYEPGSVANTSQLPGSPSSVAFQAPDMGSNSVNITYSSNQGWTGVPAYPYPAFGFANANQFETVDVNPMDGQPDIVTSGPNIGRYVAGPALPTNGQPVSGEYAVLAGFIWGTAEGEYLSLQNPWLARDIVVTITGLSNVASSYTVKLLASAHNGNPHVINSTKHFTPASVMDDAANSEMVSFAIMDEDRPNYLSTAESFEVDEDPETFNPFRSIAGMGATSTTFTGDTLTIRLSGANEYFNEAGERIRTVLAGVVIEYDSIVAPNHPGDFDGDGDVDGADFVAWQTNFPTSSNATLAQGDADGDGDVDGADFVVWQTNFPFTPSSGASPVPEPKALTLAALSMAVFVLVRRRHRLIYEG